MIYITTIITYVIIVSFGREIKADLKQEFRDLSDQVKIILGKPKDLQTLPDGSSYLANLGFKVHSGKEESLLEKINRFDDYKSEEQLDSLEIISGGNEEKNRAHEAKEMYGSPSFLSQVGAQISKLNHIMEGKKFLRRWNQRPLVEIGPGVFKSDIIQYPPDKFKNDLNKLIMLKKKMEE